MQQQDAGLGQVGVSFNPRIAVELRLDLRSGEIRFDSLLLLSLPPAAIKQTERRGPLRLSACRRRNPS